jgi:hypothetical protein
MLQVHLGEKRPKKGWNVITLVCPSSDAVWFALVFNPTISLRFEVVPLSAQARTSTLDLGTLKALPLRIHHTHQVNESFSGFSFPHDISGQVQTNSGYEKCL